MAINLEQQQQQLNKLKAQLANLKKEQSRLENLSKGGLLKKPDLTKGAGLKIATDLANKVNEVNAKQKEYDDLDKKWLIESGISYVMPYTKRGKKVIENFEECLQAAINMSKDLS